MERKSYERIQYVGRQFFAELGISQWRSLEFWATLLILLLMWWVRMYLHYLGQYAFLRIINIPVNRSVEGIECQSVINYTQQVLTITSYRSLELSKLSAIHTGRNGSCYCWSII